MKTIFITLVLMVGLLLAMTIGNQVTASTLTGSGSALVTSSGSESTKASVAGDVQIAFEQTSDDNKTPGNFFLQNWGALTMGLLAFFDVVTRLTPTTRDNSIVNLLATIINAIIPNFKKGGGKF